MTCPDLHPLLERVRSAEKGSRELDAEVWLATAKNARREKRRLAQWPDADPVWIYIYETDGGTETAFSSSLVPAYSTSLDAVVFLIEKELPGWVREIAKWREECSCTLYALNAEGLHNIEMGRVEGVAPTEPLACLIALLSAKLSMEASDDEA